MFEQGNYLEDLSQSQAQDWSLRSHITANGEPPAERAGLTVG
jgi:hypothetical protein